MIGQPLPRAEDAFIPEEKLRRYCLDPENDRGKHKAIIFQLVFGIEQENWEYLRDQILEALPNYAITGARPALSPEESLTYEVLLPITGLNARQATVATAWETIDDVPRFVTGRVTKKSDDRLPQRLQ